MTSAPIPVPHMGLVEDVMVSAWLHSNGDHVAMGDPIVTVESDKAEVEIDAPASGRLEIIITADPDNPVDVGSVLGWIHEP